MPEFTPIEVIRALDADLTGDALIYWNGCCQQLVDEMVILAQRKGIAAAISELNELGEPIGPSPS